MLTPEERALADRIDRELLYLAPERSVGEYLIEKGYVANGALTEKQLDAALDVLAMTRRPV